MFTCLPLYLLLVLFFFLVLKSDYSNGLFGLSSLMPFDTVEGSTADIPIIRSRSSIGVVTVTWEIRDATDGSLAVDDFEESSGTLVFNDGVTESVSC